MLSSADLACEEIEEPSFQAEAYSKLAVAQAELGQTREAENSAKEARGLLEGLTDLGPVVRVRARLALVQGKYLNKPAMAEYELGEAESTVEEIAATVDRVEALRLLATTCHDLDLSDDATRLMEHARQEADAADEPKSKAAALAGMAETYVAWGDTTQADALFAEALETANGIEDAWARSYAQISVATALRSAGRGTEASQLLEVADQSARLVGDTQLREQLFALIQREQRRG